MCRLVSPAASRAEGEARRLPHSHKIDAYCFGAVAVPRPPDVSRWSARVNFGAFCNSCFVMRSMIRSGTPLAVALTIEPVVEGLDWLVALVDPVVCAVEAFVAPRLVSSI